MRKKKTLCSSYSSCVLTQELLAACLSSPQLLHAINICNMQNSDLSRTHLSHNKCTSCSGTLGGTSQLLKNTVENYNTFTNNPGLSYVYTSILLYRKAKNQQNAGQKTASFIQCSHSILHILCDFLMSAKLVNTAQRSGNKNN